jgi:hypothetical protein
MHQRLTPIFLGAVFTIALGGCESHQEKVDALQKEYDQLGAQMQKDCSAEYLKVPPTLSQKCVDENKKVTEVWKRLQAERTKQ